MKAAGKLHDKAHDAAAFATGRRFHTRSRLGFGARRRVGLFLLIGQKRSAQSQSGGAMSIGHEAEVTNAMEAFRQGVQQEATNELVVGLLHDLCRVVVSVILPGEPDMIVVDLDDAAIGDGDAVRVAPEIGEHLGRTAEWFLNRSSFIGDLLLHFTRPYRTRRAVHRSSLRPRLAVCFLLVQAVVYC